MSQSHRVLQLFLLEATTFERTFSLSFQTRARELGREENGGKGEEGDTKDEALLEREHSTPQSNICPLFCITISADFQTGHDAGIKAEITFQPFIHNCYV